MTDPRSHLEQHGTFPQEDGWEEVAEARLALCQRQELELGTARAQIAALEAWKEEAMAVINGINLQEVGKELGVPLGADVGPAILPGIQALKAKAANAWRPVSAPLPKPWEVPNNTEIIVALWEGSWREPRQRRRVRTSFLYDGQIQTPGIYRPEEGDSYEITHWMLPELPTD